MTCSSTVILSGSSVMPERFAAEGTEFFDQFYDNSSHLINISQAQPVWLAQPIYGIAAPIIILITVITNTLVIIVLSHKNLRTPTNYILLSMAITELMTGLSTSPWFIYYYTLGGYLVDEEVGLPSFWCTTHTFFAIHFPTIFHTSAIWLTVFLAIQRYIYVCMPAHVMRYCNVKVTLHWIGVIICASMLFELVGMTSQYNVTYESPYTGRRYCIHRWAPHVEHFFGVNDFNAVVIWVRAFLVHILPCAFLILFTGCLFRTINEADRKRSIHTMPRRPKLSSTHHGTTTTTSSSRLMHATTRMLVVVIAIFLLIEIPVAVIFVFHFTVVYFQLMPTENYSAINNLLILRNFFIIFTYPLNFAIYFGMSSSFKLQFRQLFTRKVLYVASPPTRNGLSRLGDENGSTSNGGTSSSTWRHRFSVQLVELNKIRTVAPRDLLTRKGTGRPRSRKNQVNNNNQISRSVVEEAMTDELL